MKTTLTLFAAMAFTAPAYALTLEQAQNELAGMHCSGSSCTSEQTVTTTVQNPDVITRTEVEVSPATFEDPAQPVHDGSRGFWNERCETFAYVNADCVAQSIAPLGGGTPAVRRIDVTVTPGGTTTTVTCETTTKTLTYNGPNTSRDGAWSIDTSSSSSDGAC